MSIVMVDENVRFGRVEQHVVRHTRAGMRGSQQYLSWPWRHLLTNLIYISLVKFKHFEKMIFLKQPRNA